MPFFSRSSSKKHSEDRSTLDSVPANGLASSQSRAVHPWSAHAIERSRSPFPREGLTLSMSASAGEMFLFGGCVQDMNRQISGRPTNDLFLISTRDFSTTLLKTSGDAPSPRHGHRAILTSTDLLIWGGIKQFHDQVLDDLYLFNLASRKWTRIVVNGSGPPGRYYHSMTLVGSKLFVFGGSSSDKHLDDIWALDLNCLMSNFVWKLYGPALENEKPLPRTGHASVASDNRMIIFGGYGGTHGSNNTWFNDTWSFDISTREWTELQCTGSIPSPRAGHAVVLIDNLMYVFGGSSGSKAYLGDLSALNLSTRRWITFQNIGPSPGGRTRHGMVCDGTRIFVLGGVLSQNKQDKTKPIHILDTERLDYSDPGSDSIDSSEKTARFVQKSSAITPTPGQPHQPSSSSGARGADLTTPFQKELDHSASQQSISERPSLNNPRPTGASGRPSRVLSEDGKGSTEHRAKPVAPSVPSGKEIARLDNGRLVELDGQLSETLVAQIEPERDSHIGQLTDELVHAVEEKERAGQELHKLQTRFDESLLSHNRALEQAKANATEERRFTALELHELQVKYDRLLLSRDQAEANTAEAKKHAGLEQRALQVKLDELLLSRDQAEANTAEEKKRTELEKRELQVKLEALQARLDESLLSRNHTVDQAEASAAEEMRRAALELRELQVKFDRLLLSRDQAEADAAEAKKHAGLEQRELQVKLDRLMLSRDQAEANAAEVKRRAGLEQRELQVKLDELILSHDKHLRMLEQAQIALQEATSRAADADERSHPACEHETEVAELRAELERKKSELANVRIRLADIHGWARGKAKTDKSHTVTVANFVDLNEDLTVRDLMEDLKWSEKSVEEMDCGNEG